MTYLLNNKWFKQSSQPVTGISQNERFAERLNNVWFKKPVGIIRLGFFLTKLAERVTALEQASKTTHPVLPMKYSSSAYRTATGVAAMLQVSPDRDETVLIRAVRRFKENNSIASFVYLDGMQIEIRRDPNV